MITLFPDQEIAIEQLRDLTRQGKKRILLQAPTGWGKGTLASFMILGAVQRGWSVLFLVNRRELVRDLSRRLDKLGIDHGIIMADHPRRKPWLKVHIASIDTLRNRATKPKADLIFLDEAHFSVSDSWLDALSHYPDATVIGMTATPIRMDGRGLGHIFKDMVCGPQMAELVRLGRLARPVLFAPSAPDVSNVRTSAGEFNQKQLSVAVDRPKLVGDIVQHWLRLGKGRPSVAFAVDIGHSQHIRDEFIKAGIRAKHVDANTPDEERDRTWAELASGELEVCCSVRIVSYGWDCPPVSCAIDAAPTQSLAMVLQRWGRVLRAHPGKETALILDHAGNAQRHNTLPDDDREWVLEDVMEKKKGAAEVVVSIVVCPDCFLTYRATSTQCPQCGAERPRHSALPETVAGELVERRRQVQAKCLRCTWRGMAVDEVDMSKVACPACQCMTVVRSWKNDAQPDIAAQREDFFEMERSRRANGYKPGFSKLAFHRKYGNFPPLAWLEEFDRRERMAQAERELEPAFV